MVRGRQMGGTSMRKLTKKQKSLIDSFIKNNRSAPMFASCSIIDNGGLIENLNRYESCWSDIERYYADNYNKF